MKGKETVKKCPCCQNRLVVTSEGRCEYCNRIIVREVVYGIAESPKEPVPASH